MDWTSTWLVAEFLGTATWIWLVFATVVVGLLAFDLGVLHKDDRAIGVGESLLLSAGYIGAAVAFGAWLWWMKDATPAARCGRPARRRGCCRRRLEGVRVRVRQVIALRHGS